MITHDWCDSVTNSYLVWRLPPPCLLSLALNKARCLSSNLRRWPRSQVLRPPPKAKRVSQLGSKASSPAECPGNSGPGHYPVASQTEWYIVLINKFSRKHIGLRQYTSIFLELLWVRNKEKVSLASYESLYLGGNWVMTWAAVTWTLSWAGIFASKLAHSPDHWSISAACLRDR